MNSSTYRTSAASNRLLKILTGTTSDDKKDLLPAAGKAYKVWTGKKQWPRTELETVREEANDLKHKDEGLYSGRGLWKKNAVVAIGQLLTFTEAWLAYKKQQKK